MELELLKHKFHNLIDQLDNVKLLEHFYEIIYNLHLSKERQKLLLEELEQYENSENFSNN